LSIKDFKCIITAYGIETSTILSATISYDYRLSSGF
jgi:hypothetical protein